VRDEMLIVVITVFLGGIAALAIITAWLTVKWWTFVIRLAARLLGLDLDEENPESKQ
jgi:hypothetical protein